MFGIMKMGKFFNELNPLISNVYSIKKSITFFLCLQYYEKLKWTGVINVKNSSRILAPTIRQVSFTNKKEQSIKDLYLTEKV